MHFSIPLVQELVDGIGTAYQAFDVHINGALHCVVRYSQLHGMNEQLKQEFDYNILPSFPRKHIFTLKGDSLEDRRLQLEEYLQEISQNESLLHSPVFTSFLQKAQQETRLEQSVSTNLDVYLMNNSKVSININSTDQTEDVQENLLHAIGLHEDLVYYFGLFLVEYDVENDRIILVRQLQDFECPYISLKYLKDRGNYRIVLRKSFWDPSYDAMILHDSVAVNLLHVQAEKDLKMGWFNCNKTVKKQLNALTKKGSKYEYLQLCQTLQKYGYVQFEKCVSDYPSNKTRVAVSIGGNEIRFKYQNNKCTNDEATFQVTRIKSWKISSKHSSSNQGVVKDDKLQLSFEYLADKDNLKWISLWSNQAIVISMCIKSMVNEILAKQKQNKIKKPSDRASRKHYDYKLRDETMSKLFQSPLASEACEDSVSKDSVTRRFSKKLKKVNRKSKTFRKSTGGNSSDSDEFLLLNAHPIAESSTFYSIGEDDL